MRVPFLLLVVSLGGAWATSGVPMSLLFAWASIAALILLCHASFRWLCPAPGPSAKDTPLPDAQVVIDGSNVMHWNGEEPRLATLQEVITALRGKGYQPGVIFDANVGYKLCDRYLDDRALAHLLDLPADRVLVVPKGEPADPTILAAARELRARVVSNDRFRDWAERFPEVTSPGLLMKGGYRNGDLWLAAGVTPSVAH